jgi:uncharacterized membrane protein
MSERPEERAEESGEAHALRLEVQLAAVTARVYELERTLAAMREVPPANATRHAQAAVSVASAVAQAAVLPRRPAAPEHSLESRVGSQWFNRIGIIAVLIGVAWFLKFAFDSHWVGALGRVLVGLGCGAALVGWSERFRAKGFAGFSYSLKALGTGVLYLSLWAAVSVYHLIAPGLGFAGMVAVTAWNALVAWRQDAELLAVYAIVGAFATPLLLATGQNQEAFLFCYLLLMNAAMLTLLVVKGWNRLLVLAFLGTVGLYCNWYWSEYAAAASTPTLVFLLLFFLLFVAATVLGRRRERAQGDGSQDDVARLFVSMANAAFGFVGVYAMLYVPGGAADTQLAGWALGFAGFYLAARWAMQLATPGAAASLPLRRGLVSLADVHLTLAIAFATLAIPLAVHGHWVTVGWMVEGAGLVWLATRRRSRLMEVLAAVTLVLGLCALAVDATVGQQQAIWNPRLLSFAVAIAAMTVCAGLARRAARESTAQAAMWRFFGVAGEVTATVLLAIAGVLEIHTWWWTRTVAGAVGSREYLGALKDRAQAAQFTYSAWLLLLSVGALTAGFRRRSAVLRWEGLVLLAVTIVKVFLADTSELTQGYRIVSFLLLGVLLLGVSFAYQRDWLRLRAE